MPRLICCLSVLLTILVGCGSFNAYLRSPFVETYVICTPAQPSKLETLAAREMQRVLYQRTGEKVAVIHSERGIPAWMSGVALAGKERALAAVFAADAPSSPALSALKPQQYMIKTIETQTGNQQVLIAGGDDAGTLYGAYRYAEHLGARFYLHGDVFPDQRMKLALPALEEYGKPLFELRGIQPFHDFNEGPDWWNEADYQCAIGQLAKLRMNFIGLHTYPEGGPHAEPTVWIGQTKDVEPDGRVTASYPSTYNNTIRADAVPGNWGYESKKTGDFIHGAAQMFDRDAYGPAVMNNHFPKPDTPEACNDVFNRTGLMLKTSFELAHALGVKTCVGTETPLTIPKLVRDRLSAQNKSTTDTATLMEVYSGIFSRIMKTYPIDYYWMWTPEWWTWTGTTPEASNATLKDMQAACAAAQAVGAPFKLATCGWVLGPQFDRALFDRELPKEMALSCINRAVGMTPVEAGFTAVQGRPKWAIPWMEDDPALTAPQLWAARMRRDGADAFDYGCTGLMGIHWRTRILEPNVAALAAAGWQQEPWHSQWRAKQKGERKSGPLSGKYASFPPQAVGGTTEDPVYLDVRWNVKGYDFEVPNGTYTVTLCFNEPIHDAPGKRIFGVKLQGEKVLDKFDIFSQAGGKNIAVDEEFRNIEVTAGWLSIAFDGEVEHPAIAAIIIEGIGFTKKINCGGPAWKDYQADWPENEYTEITPEILDFYTDWARVNFGETVAPAIAALFARIDGKLPRPFDWIEGPGGLAPSPTPWEQVAKQYAFVDELAAHRPQVTGAGNLERFDYWLHQFQYLKTGEMLRCHWANFDRVMNEVNPQRKSKDQGQRDAVLQAPDLAERRQKVRAQALPIRREMVRLTGELYGHLLATVSNIGEMGTVSNINQHTVPAMLERPGEELEKLLGEPLSADLQPDKAYHGPARVFLRSRRTMAHKGESLKFQAVILSEQPLTTAVIYWRPLGGTFYRRQPLMHINRGCYTAEIPASATRGTAIEYYIQMKAGAEQARYPATAPGLNETVVVMD